MIVVLSEGSVDAVGYEINLTSYFFTMHKMIRALQIKIPALSSFKILSYLHVKRYR